jgi:23S rRNA-/tRNA-specific pseudouridylate synthase
MEGLIEGRIVHLVTSEREGAKHYAAIVAGVVDRKSGIVNLGVWTSNGNQYAMFEVPYSEKPKPRTWHWIER